MWIQISTPTSQLFDRDVMDDPVTFTANGKAQVTADVGDALCERYPSITPVSDDGAVSSDASESDADADDGDELPPYESEYDE